MGGPNGDAARNGTPDCKHTQARTAILTGGKFPGRPREAGPADELADGLSGGPPEDAAGGPERTGSEAPAAGSGGVGSVIKRTFARL